VLVRRGRIVPVCDVAQVLVGPNAPARKFYLIANRRFDAASEWTAIPVSGECELASAQPAPRTEGLPRYVTGLLPLNGEIIEIVDLEKFAPAATITWIAAPVRRRWPRMCAHFCAAIPKDFSLRRCSTPPKRR